MYLLPSKNPFNLHPYLHDRSSSKMHPVYTQGEIRAVPQGSEGLHPDNLRTVVPATSDATRHEEARAAEPKAEDRQVGQAETVAEGDKPQRTRSRPLGPREQAPPSRRTTAHRETRAETDVQQVGEARTEAVTSENKPQRTSSGPLERRDQAVLTLRQAAIRRQAAARTHVEQVGDTNPGTVTAENKPQRTRSRPLGPRPPASELLRRPTRREIEAQTRPTTGERRRQSPATGTTPIWTTRTSTNTTRLTTRILRRR